jgi:hypothetical protein
MKPISVVSSILTIGLAVSTPNLSFAHVGHGDEFQAEGGIERVQVNPETDSMLGIVVTPIDETAAEGVGVMIPATALVDADGKQLVFVQYDNFYEPVFVTTGTTQGELIEVTEGLSVTGHQPAPRERSAPGNLAVSLPPRYDLTVRLHGQSAGANVFDGFASFGGSHPQQSTFVYTGSLSSHDLRGRSTTRTDIS